jgi:hypothetical protein
VVFFIETLGSIASLGPHGITRYNWATMEYVHIIHLPFLILEQAGLVMLIAWITKIYGAISVSFWIVSFSVSRVFRGLNYKSAILILAPVYFILLLIPLTPKQIFIAEQFLHKIGVFLFFPYPVILWILAFLGKRRSPVIESR